MENELENQNDFEVENPIKDFSLITKRADELCGALQARKDMSAAYGDLVKVLSEESGISKKVIRAYANALLNQTKVEAEVEAEELLSLLDQEEKDEN